MSQPLVCFDLDGTVFNPGGSIRFALNHALQSQGFQPFAPEEVLIGMPLRDILLTKTQDPAAIEAMVEAFRTSHQEKGWMMASFHDGFPDLIQTVRDLGCKTAVVTTKGESEAIHMMDQLQINHLWDTIVGDNDVRPIKPDPAPVLAACERMGVAPAAAVMIGDTSFDIDAGRAAGTYTIGVSWGNGSQWGAGPTGADVIVDDAAGLMAEIKGWLSRHNR